RIPLHALGQRRPHAELATGRETHIDVAVGGVLDVFLEIELHQRIPAARADAVLGSERHPHLGRLFPFALFLSRLGYGRPREQTARGRNYSSSEAELAAQIEKPAPLLRYRAVCIVVMLVDSFHVS